MVQIMGKLLDRFGDGSPVVRAANEHAAQAIMENLSNQGPQPSFLAETLQARQMRMLKRQSSDFHFKEDTLDEEEMGEREAHAIITAVTHCI